MKIKVVRVAEDVYNIYHGFTGLPFTFPFHTKWVIDRERVTMQEASEYINRFALCYTNKAVLYC